MRDWEFKLINKKLTSTFLEYLIKKYLIKSTNPPYTNGSKTQILKDKIKTFQNLGTKIK